MKSLYARIFIWFLCGNLLVALATLVVARPLLKSWAEQREARAYTLGEDAVSRYEKDGHTALLELLRQWRASHGIQVHLISPDGRPLHRPPSPIRQRFERHAQRPGGPRPPPPRLASGPQAPPAGTSPVMAEVAGTQGRYRVIAHLPAPRSELRQPLRVLQLVTAVLVLAVLSWLLSRALARPLADLSDTVRAMGAGDLDARASPTTRARGDEIGALAAEFDRMASRIQTLVENQQRLLRDISHELRSPLARMEVALELARERGGAQAELERIAKESARLEQLIDQILHYTRLRSDQKADEEELDLAALARECAADLRYGLDAAVDVRETLPESCPVRGDAALLRSAIDNLLRNAGRHAPPGTTIELRLSADGDHVELTVSDTGPGVPADQLTRIFEPFYRAAADRDRRSGGTGVGLAIVAEVMRVHGGRAEARNRAGGGLEVVLSLPRTR